jgi:hypothetical protein
MKMWFWIVWTAILIVVAGVQFSAASRSSTVYQTYASTYLTRQQIRQMPLLERPNRPGHFYGNTVRRLHNRRMSRGYYGR